MTEEMKKAPGAWLLWSFVVFVLFYAPLTFAAAYGPGWLVSGTWQLTIVAGVLLAPLFFIHTAGKKVRQKIPVASLSISCIILLGIVLIQLPSIKSVGFTDLMLGLIPVVVAAFAYLLRLNTKKNAVVGENRAF